MPPAQGGRPPSGPNRGPRPGGGGGARPAGGGGRPGGGRPGGSRPGGGRPGGRPGGPPPSAFGRAATIGEGRGHRGAPQKEHEREPYERERENGRLREMPRHSTQPATLVVPKVIELPASLTVKEFSELIGVPPATIIRELLRNGVMATINQEIDYDTAATVAQSLGIEVKEAPRPEPVEAQLQRVGGKLLLPEDDPSRLRPRPPVVTIMGHVDHGKTSLLDAIRQTNVAAREAGGITQHIGAYQVEKDVEGERRLITFIDTPGHEAFTAMRARGAMVTDIAIIVVAADDGVMPQTIEAISHARAAEVPIIIAINKIDRPNADPERVHQQLAEHQVVVREWGGDVECVHVSAKTHEGLDDLLLAILLLAEELDLRANPDRPAIGTIIESRLDRSKGPVATILVQTGTLHVNDTVVAGQAWGRVRAMFDHTGRRLQAAGPSTPVEILGLNDVPVAGDRAHVETDPKVIRELERGLAQRREAEPGIEGRRAASLEEILAQIQSGQVKELNVVLKADVQGSLEAIKKALEKLDQSEVRLRILHEGVGAISESDVHLAAASNAIIIGFNTKPDVVARRTAEVEGVDIRYYQIIYNLVDDMSKALKGMLAPQYEEVIEGHAEVRAVFRAGRGESVVGCYVQDGHLVRGAPVRVVRGGQIVWTGRISSLRRFKDDVREVHAGYECGVGLEGFNDAQVGDILETFSQRQVQVT